MKNLLSENMMRFGNKNLSEAAQKELTLKSILETIDQYGLQREVRKALAEQADPNLGLAQKIVGMIWTAISGMGTDDPKVLKAVLMIKTKDIYNSVVTILKTSPKTEKTSVVAPPISTPTTLIFSFFATFCIITPTPKHNMSHNWPQDIAEMHTKFASITGNNEVVVVTSFHIEFGATGGDLNICLPYSMIEPVRDLLIRPLQEIAMEEVDPIAQEILAANTASLSKLVASVMQQIGFTNNAYPLVVGGSVLVRQHKYRHRLWEHLTTEHCAPGELLVAEQPVLGALKLAAQMTACD